jgi:hypothetical protein
MKKHIFTLLTVLAIPMAASSQQLLGTYKLVSFESTFEDGTKYTMLGTNPTGYAIITPKRFMTMLASPERQPGSTPDAKAALLNSLIAYSGPYTIEGSKLITAVDISWNQTWTGTKQGRTWTLEGNQLILVTDKAPSVKDPSKLAVGRLVWEKVE